MCYNVSCTMHYVGFMGPLRTANPALLYFLFLPGIFTISLGIAFATASNLGTLPLSGLPYTLSLDPANYFIQLACIILGIAIVAPGLSIELSANTIMLPVDGFVKAIVMTHGTNFCKTKAPNLQHCLPERPVASSHH